MLNQLKADKGNLVQNLPVKRMYKKYDNKINKLKQKNQKTLVNPKRRGHVPSLFLLLIIGRYQYLYNKEIDNGLIIFERFIFVKISQNLFVLNFFCNRYNNRKKTS